MQQSHPSWKSDPYTYQDTDAPGILPCMLHQIKYPGVLYRCEAYHLHQRLRNQPLHHLNGQSSFSEKPLPSQHNQRCQDHRSAYLHIR